jgi:hypothetical protein
MSDREVQTVEQTGKRWKGQILLAVLLIIGSMVWGIVEYQGNDSTPNPRVGYAGALFFSLYVGFCTLD